MSTLQLRLADGEQNVQFSSSNVSSEMVYIKALMGASVQGRTDVRKAMNMEFRRGKSFWARERALTISKHLDCSETTFTTAHLEPSATEMPLVTRVGACPIM